MRLWLTGPPGSVTGAADTHQKFMAALAKAALAQVVHAYMLNAAITLLAMRNVTGSSEHMPSLADSIVLGEPHLRLTSDSSAAM